MRLRQIRIDGEGAFGRDSSLRKGRARLLQRIEAEERVRIGEPGVRQRVTGILFDRLPELRERDTQTARNYFSHPGVRNMLAIL